jgi:hypothetical protein
LVRSATVTVVARTEKQRVSAGRRPATVTIAQVTLNRYRLIDTAGSELGFIELEPAAIDEGAAVHSPEGVVMSIVEVYDDEDGREGGVAATLVVDGDV